jgi:hypothetical protein
MFRYSHDIIQIDIEQKYFIHTGIGYKYMFIYNTYAIYIENI